MQYAVSSEPTDSRKSLAKVRLAYVINRYPAGSHTFIRREIQGLESRGHEVLRVSIRTADPGLPDPTDQRESELTMTVLSKPAWKLLVSVIITILRVPGRFVSALSLSLCSIWRRHTSMLRACAYLVEACFLTRELAFRRIQHVHAHFGTNAAAVVRLVHRLGGPAYSLTVHGPDEFDRPEQLDLAGKVAESSFAVAISQFCSAQLQRWVAPAHWSKIAIVHCTVNEEFATIQKPVDPNSQCFVCIGRLAPEKGHHIIFGAVARLAHDYPQLRVVLVGDGELRGQLERYARELGIQDRVEMTGWLDGRSVSEIMNRARALVLPSFAEGLPLVAMEAFALGRPVISSCVAGIPELVREGVNGWLVVAGSVEELGSAMRKALDMPTEVLDKMGAAGASVVRDEFWTDSQVSKLEQLFLATVQSEVPDGAA